MFFVSFEMDANPKWCYDENRIFSIEAILKHKEVVCVIRKMLIIFNYLFSFQRCSSFWNMKTTNILKSSDDVMHSTKFWFQIW